MDQVFFPARSKLEAVARISALTHSGPETLGPGSKERRSVLDNLAAGLGLDPQKYDSKQDLARALASKLGFRWSPECESVGQTITLSGLNLLLEHASKFLQHPVPRRTSVYEEVCLIKSVLQAETPKYMDGRSSVIEMKLADSENWRQTEWQGWYFEFRVIPALINSLGGGPTIIANTKFDYSLSYPWDLKTHSLYGRQGPSRPNRSCQLNDQISMLQAVQSTGLGLIILSGFPSYDDASFTTWHKQERGSSTPPRKQLKDAFVSNNIEFFFFENRDELERTIRDKILVEFRQGKQQSGHLRAPKFSLVLDKARNDKIKIDELLISD